MACHQVILLLASVMWITVVTATGYYQDDYDMAYKVPMAYQFDWMVKHDPTLNDYRQEEQRDGYLTKGLYQVLLPDGRYQTVTYVIDKDSGFLADVSYAGDSSYGSRQSEPSYPSYASFPSYPTKPSYPEYPRQHQVNSFMEYPPLESYEPYPAVDPYSAPIMTPMTERPKTVTEPPATTVTEVKEAGKYEDYMLPIYRIDMRSSKAREMSAESKLETMGLAKDAVDAVIDYIRPSAFYSAPEKLGSYVVDHRKGAKRKPSSSDYLVPQSILNEN